MTLRCAIYTRKSSDEGLEQEFNSLDAQREACAAYIVSQKHAGWEVLEDVFEDGGYSGGNTERPALQRLLTEIRNNKIDIVVVYKVDRLTRSLTDFVRTMEIFNRHNTSFISVTQHFNTTSSMGRLTLNVLLSFAQFEREVTGERIRDKIAASKKKGMWMGGTIPLGYDAKDKKLVINESEARLIEHIFKRYLVLQNTHKLAAELNSAGHCNKKNSGKFWHGPLRLLLMNPVYRGFVRHKGKIYPGMHQAIIDEKLWYEVQVILRGTSLEAVRRNKAGPGNLLRGFLFDAEGNSLQQQMTKKSNGKTYAYYGSRFVSKYRHDDLRKYTHIDAWKLENLIIQELISFLRDGERIIKTLSIREPQAAEAIVLRASKIAAVLERAGGMDLYKLLRSLLDKVIVTADCYFLIIKKKVLHKSLRGMISIQKSCQLYNFGIERSIIAATMAELPDAETWLALRRTLVTACIWWEQIMNNDGMSPGKIMNITGAKRKYVNRIIQFAFLAPELVELIVTGEARSGLNLRKILGRLPVVWREQKEKFNS